MTIVVVCACLGALPALAKTQTESVLKGKVFEKAGGEPAGWATVALMTADSTVVTGSTCDAEGAYELKAPAGKYVLTASLIGYQDFTQEVSLASGVNDFDPIYLETDAKILSAATVTERVKLVEMKIDKVVMNVGQSAFADGSNALDLIKKAPGVTVDKDGNVMLNGKTVSIWIDGRPSYADGKSLEALLRSTNGESIDKFELMEHPSAKYDASGKGGIINIKTKRNHLQGFNGSMGLGGGGMYFSNAHEQPWQQTYWVNLAYRTKKTNTFFRMYEGLYNSPLQMINELFIGPSDFHQVSRSSLNSFYHNYNLKIGNDWFIDEKNTIGVIAYVPGSYDTFKSSSSTTDQYVGGKLIQQAGAIIDNGPDRSIKHNLNLNYTHVFDESRSAEITANLDYYHNSSVDISNQTDSTENASAPGVKVFSRKSMESDNIYDIYSAKADYQTVVWKKFMLESGAKWALSRTDNNNIEQQTMVPDVHQYFVYREHVAAAYASLAGQLGPKLSFKAGLRGEYTNSYGDWKSSGTDMHRDYFDLFPTAFLGFQATEKLNLGASYSRRISRPGYYLLNPAKVYVDSKAYTVGNPDILPSYSSELALTIGLGQHLSWALAYNSEDGMVEQIPTYTSDGTQYLTWGNYGSMKLGVLAFNVTSLPIGKWAQWTMSLAGLYVNSTSDMTKASQNSWNVQGNTELSFLLPKNWTVAVDGYYTSPMVMGLYHMYTMWESSMVVKKSLLDNKLTLSLKLEDIFRSGNMDIDMVDDLDPTTYTAIQQLYCNQKLLLDITWNFGKAQNPVKRRNVGNLEEMSRASGGGGFGKK